MNKKWIEFVEKHTDMRCDKVTGLIMLNRNGKIARPQPEDLIGWQLRFAEECGYYIHVIGYDFIDKEAPFCSHVFKSGVKYESGIEHEWFKTYLEAFNSAWEKFLEMKK